MKTYGVVFVGMGHGPCPWTWARTCLAFLDVFDWFIHRRGICQVLYSDCGTQYRGPDGERRRSTSISQKWGRSVASKQHLLPHMEDCRRQSSNVVPTSTHHHNHWLVSVSDTTELGVPLFGGGRRVLTDTHQIFGGARWCQWGNRATC